MPRGKTGDYMGAKEPDQMLHWYALEVMSNGGAF